MIGALVFAVPARGQGTAPSGLASQYVDERAGLELDTAIDESLIGGAVIDAGDVVIDGSLKGKLARLQSALAQ